MKIITEHANPTITYVGKAIEKDPLSWSGWNLLEIKVVTHLDGPFDDYDHRALQGSIQRWCEGGSGMILFCANGDIVILSKNISAAGLLTCGHSVAGMVEKMEWACMSVSLLNVATQWKEVGSICRSYATQDDNNPEEEFTLTPQHSNAFLRDDVALLDASFYQITQNNLSTRRFIKPSCVLLVEDDPMTQRIASAALKNNCRLVIASSAEEAIVLYLLHAPDVLFLDINLPDHSGFSVLHSILHCDKDAYVVMFSSDGYADNLADALNIGARGFITKPFRREVLWHYIRDCDAHHHLQEAH